MDKRLIGACNALTSALISGGVRINRGPRDVIADDAPISAPLGLTKDEGRPHSEEKH
jgi:hypothetical protein